MLPLTETALEPSLLTCGSLITSVELFTGCGGLALGISRAGVKHLRLIERDQEAAATVRANAAKGVAHIAEWPYARADVRDVDWSCFENVDVVSGGPPCQPFGIGGKALGPNDQRDMWPEAVRAIRETKPVAFAFENVFGMLRERFEDYVAWIQACLECPEYPRRHYESHAAHLKRLSRLPKSYTVVIQSVNAAEFGAPQNRRRILFLGVRTSAHVYPQLLRRTHSRDRLLFDQYVTGEYWLRHGLDRAKRTPTLHTDHSQVARLARLNSAPAGLPWVTVRDAVVGLGEPSGVNGHVFQPGARVYQGHTGSPLDLPAKALKAGDHGVPGGENMMVKDDGSVRYFTIRESARLMGLPDDYVFPRSWSESMRQMGNAVPVQFGEAVGAWLVNQVEQAREQKLLAA